MTVRNIHRACSNTSQNNAHCHRQRPESHPPAVGFQLDPSHSHAEANANSRAAKFRILLSLLWLTPPLQRRIIRRDICCINVNEASEIIPNTRVNSPNLQLL
ncbi:Delta(14)-sterol reductase [Fusarium oxysporum f. sp. albedinis]|nr:Delta(14)-sterol reductase [Fusarium oxysporum f. sp. albedinis]